MGLMQDTDVYQLRAQCAIISCSGLLMVGTDPRHHEKASARLHADAGSLVQPEVLGLGAHHASDVGGTGVPARCWDASWKDMRHCWSFALLPPV